MRAAGNFAEATGESELPWDKWADFVEHGVDTTWGVLLIEEEIITERTTARRIGLLFENLAQQSVVTTEQIRQELLEILDNDHRTVERALELFELLSDVAKIENA